VAAKDKCLAQGNKSSAWHEATNRRENGKPALIPLDVFNETDNQNKVHRTANCARDARASKLQSRSFGRVIV
jgi:hypothetical protein